MTSTARKLPNLSPSAFTTWDRCRRRWWFERVDGRRPPPSPAMALGTKVHDCIEKYLLSGVLRGDDDIVRIVRAGLGFLAPLRDGVENRGGRVEQGFKLPRGELGDLPVNCKVDYIEPLHVTDHKTTSSLFGPWHKTPTQLEADPQMLFYAYLGLREDYDTGPPRFEMQHIYYQTKGAAESRMLRVHVTWDDARRNRDAFVDASREMFRALDIERAEDIAGNEDACGDFGGCPHSAYCPIRKQASNGANASEGGSTMGFRERLAARRAAMLEKAQQTPKTPPPSEGQMNPPDSPGVEAVTSTQLDEIVAVARAALGDKVAADEARLWLRSRGRPDMVRIGLGIAHIPRILAHMFPSAVDDAVAEIRGEPAEQPAPPSAGEPADSSNNSDLPPEPAPATPGLFDDKTEPAPADTVPREAVETAKSDGVFERPPPAGDTTVSPLSDNLPKSPAATEAAAVVADADDEHTAKVQELTAAILDYLQKHHNDGTAASIEELKPTIRKVTGRKRIDANVIETWLYGQDGAFAAGAYADLWDYCADDTAAVMLTGGQQETDPDVGGPPAAESNNPAPPTNTSNASAETTDDTTDDPTPAGTRTGPHTSAERQPGASWARTVFCVDCLPERTVPLATLDDLLADYYTEAARGENALHYTLIEYARGPGIVAALVIADVREGRFEPVHGFVFVAGSHPMARYLGNMFPDALAIRGTR